MGLPDGGGFTYRLGFAGFDGKSLFQGLLQFALRVIDLMDYFEGSLFCGIVRDFATYFYRSFLLIYMRGTDEDTIGTMIQKIEMLFGGSDKPYITVYATPECEVGRYGSNIFSAVVYRDFYRVVLLDIGGDIECKSTVPACMAAYFLSVQHKVCRFAGCIYF